jgi:hypothetical protein
MRKSNESSRNYKLVILQFKWATSVIQISTVLKLSANFHAVTMFAVSNIYGL